jgi:GAF domain-containing protein
MEKIPICKESIVWKVVEDGIPVNLTKADESEGYRHTLAEKIKHKAVVPLWYVDQLTQEEKSVGALIVDCGKKRAPVSAQDFEYLKVVGELIGAAAGKAELTEQLIESYKRKEIMVRETAHAFRNRITAIGGFSRRIAELAKDKDLGDEARLLYQEVQLLESHLEQFEKYL